jgi:hypothetical protein
MLQYEAHVNTFDKTNGSSPLHDACFSGSLKCVKALVEAGAHVDLQTKSHKNKNKGAVALHYAAQQNRHDIVEYLIRQNANVNIQDARACTPLHYAAYTGPIHLPKPQTLNPTPPRRGHRSSPHQRHRVVAGGLARAWPMIAMRASVFACGACVLPCTLGCADVVSRTPGVRLD